MRGRKLISVNARPMPALFAGLVAGRFGTVREIENMTRNWRGAAAVAVLAAAMVTSHHPASAQHPPQAKGDPREAVSLSDAEVENLLAGMRLYLETIQGIVAAIAENQPTRVSDIAVKSGARLLQKVYPSTGLKLPLGFTSMSFDTHDKFDKLADKAKNGASRTIILNDLRDIMGNCISCHAAYRLAP